MASKFGRYYKKFFTNIVSSVTFFSWVVVFFYSLGNEDGDMSSFNFLFRLYVTLTLFSEKNKAFRGCYVTQVNVFNDGFYASE